MPALALLRELAERKKKQAESLTLLANEIEVAGLTPEAEEILWEILCQVRGGV